MLKHDWCNCIANIPVQELAPLAPKSRLYPCVLVNAEFEIDGCYLEFRAVPEVSSAVRIRALHLPGQLYIIGQWIFEGLEEKLRTKDSLPLEPGAADKWCKRFGEIMLAIYGALDVSARHYEGFFKQQD